MYRIAVVLDDSPSSGGGFVHGMATAKNLFFAARRSAKYSFEFLVTSGEVFSELSEIPGMKVELLSMNKPARALAFLARIFSKSPAIRIIQHINVVENFFIKKEVDFIVFLTPSYLARNIWNINYAFSIWDLCYRDEPVFPEIRECNSIVKKDLYLYESILKSSFVLCDSAITQDKLHAWTGLPKSRFIPSSFSSPLLAGPEKSEESLIKSSRAPLPVKYLLYPAKHWPHKNIGFALEILGALPSYYRLILTLQRADLGSLIIPENILDRVEFRGRVSTEGLRELYQVADALVMTSFFGPTNIPPLEAMVLGVPVFVLQTPENISHYSDAVGYLDMYSAKKSAASINDLLISPSKTRRAIARGRDFVSGLPPAYAENIMNNLDAFVARYQRVKTH